MRCDEDRKDGSTVWEELKFMMDSVESCPLPFF